MTVTRTIVGPKRRRAAAIAKKLGFTWGSDGTSFRDYPHIQYDGGLSITQVKQGKLPAFKSIKCFEVSSQTPSTAKTTASKQIGVVKVLVSALNVREDASFTSKVVKFVKKGEAYRVYAKKNGMYNVGGKQWVSSGSRHTVYTPL